MFLKRLNKVDTTSSSEKRDIFTLRLQTAVEKNIYVDLWLEAFLFIL